jgi:hypothetical protein
VLVLHTALSILHLVDKVEEEERDVHCRSSARPVTSVNVLFPCLVASA